MLDWILALREELAVPHELPSFKVDDKKFDLMSKWPRKIRRQAATRAS